MNLSNRLTLSLVCFVLLMAFATGPAMAATIKAEWVADKDDDGTADDPAWEITVGGLAKVTEIAVRAVVPNGDEVASSDINITQPTNAADVDATATIDATVGTVIAVQVEVTLPNTEDRVYQRVTFPAAAKGAKVEGATAGSAKNLTLIPMLKKLTKSQYYVNFDMNEVTVMFDFADAEDGEHGAPSAPLHRSDVAAITGDWQLLSVSGTNMVKVRSTSAHDAASDDLAVSLVATYAQAATPATPANDPVNGTATVTFDNMPPVAIIADQPLRPVALASEFQTPEIDENTVWDEEFFFTFIINDTGSMDTTAGADANHGGPDFQRAHIMVDTTKLTIVQAGKAADQTLNSANDEPLPTGIIRYLIQFMPKADRVTTAGEAVMITVTPVDKSGNRGTSKSHTVKLAEKLAPPPVVQPPPPGRDTTPPRVGITSAAGAADTADAGKVIFTFTFNEILITTGDNAFTVADLDVSNSPALVASNLTTTNNTVFTLKVTPTNDDFPVKVSFKSGAKIADPSGNVMTDLSRTGTYTPPNVLGVEIDAPANLTLGVLTFTFTFAEAPADAEDASGAFTVSDIRVSNAEPLVDANLVKQLQSGDSEEVIYELDVTPMDTTKPVTVQLKARSVSNGKTGTELRIAGQISATWTPPVVVVPPPVVADGIIRIPAGKFVVVVRDKDAAGASGLAFRSDVMVQEWPDMPNLERLFYTGNDGIILGGGGGGALILKNATGQTPVLNPGTVGISEIMWGIDATYFGEDREDASQWIELHNLNATTANVVLSWKTGRAITSDGSITGNLAAPVLDVVTNFFNNRPGSPRWEVKGSNGSSAGGVNFVSMARILPHNKTAYANADGARYNNRDGRAAGHWSASGVAYLRLRTILADQTDVVYEYRGTPGRVNSFRAETQQHIRVGRTGIATNNIRINEVGNFADDKYDWIELINGSGGEINLRNYMISRVTSNSSDVPLIQFDNNDNAKVGAGGVFLLLRTDPADDPNHPIAATGYNVDKSAEEQQPGTPSSPVRYKVFNSLNLPNDGNFVLVVRRPDGHQGQRSGAHGSQGVAETGNADLDKIVDIAGWDNDLSRNSYPNAVSSTGVWPLYQMRDIRGFTNNKFEVGKVHQRNRVSTNDGASGVGAAGNNNAYSAFGDVGWTGVGYRRDVANTAMHGGTPGYPNGASHGAGTAITSAVYISEIMYVDGSRNGSLPQWIEIRNTSKTTGADLHNWRLTIKNHVDATTHEDSAWEGKIEASVLLRGLKIKPNSSVLITSRKGPRSDVHLADSEIFSLYPNHRTAFGMKNANSDVINTYGFRITLHANGHDGNRNKWQLVDDVGNLATPNPNARFTNNERFDMPRWMWPDATAEDGSRISVARKLKNKDTRVATDGSKRWSWLLSSADSRYEVIDFVYYGHVDDTSTPGQTVSSPLPVSLSFFRPTLEDGEVVIRWVTESELNNAGFNIYRSESRDGEFKQVNGEMVQGNGTTGERSTYKWVDETAKPNAVYFYQIEDVSFAGERQLLATTKLKGLISAKGKLTTSWGNIKEASQ